MAGHLSKIMIEVIIETTGFRLRSRWPFGQNILAKMMIAPVWQEYDERWVIHNLRCSVIYTVVMIKNSLALELMDIVPKYGYTKNIGSSDTSG